MNYTNLPDIPSILFFGSNDVVGLSAIRAIGAAFPHTSIHTLSTAADSVIISNYSKYVNHHHTINSSDGEELLQELIFHIKKIGALILLPVDEDNTKFVSTHLETLKKHVKLPPLSPVEILDSVIRKNSLAELLTSKGFETPETYPVKGLNPRSLPQDFFPCIMKPFRGSGGIGFKNIKDYSELVNILADDTYDNYIVQKLISGYDLDCSFLAVDGEIRAYTIQQGLAQDGYSFSKAIRFENDKVLFDQVERFIREIGYSGIAHLDYRVDDRDGKPKLVDFNARYWSTLEGSKAAGIDFTLLNCLEALGIPYEKPNFKHCNYLLGRAVLNRSKSKNGHIPTFTDLKSRITDPVPELLRFFCKID